MRIVCTACSCLCDDIVIEGGKVYHACRKGYNLLRGEREVNTVDGEKCDFEKAVKSAIDVFGNAKRPLIFGLDNVNCETQKLALKLAKNSGAIVADHSTLSCGELIKLAISRKHATLEEFRDRGYVSIYWGSNPHNGIPRHLSRFTYYPRSGKRQRGYEEDRFLVVVDVRKSETAKIAEKSKSGLFIRVEKDSDLIDSFLKALEGKAGKYVEVARALKEMEKSDLNAIFGGSGLYFGLNGGLESFEGMLDRLADLNVHFIPANTKANMRGFVELMLKETGSLCYDFGEGEACSLKEAFSLCDVALIVGADPFRTVPWTISSMLREREVILVNSLKSVTGRLCGSRVKISPEISCFSGGTMVRSDGVEVRLSGGGKERSDEAVMLSLLNQEV